MNITLNSIRISDFEVLLDGKSIGEIVAMEDRDSFAFQIIEDKTLFEQDELEEILIKLEEVNRTNT